MSLQSVTPPFTFARFADNLPYFIRDQVKNATLQAFHQSLSDTDISLLFIHLRDNLKTISAYDRFLKVVGADLAVHETSNAHPFNWTFIDPEWPSGLWAYCVVEIPGDHFLHLKFAMVLER